MQAIVHISTCYVSGTARGWVQEAVDPLPFDARELGDEFARMREPSPGTLMMGRMGMTMKEALPDSNAIRAES